MIRQAQIAGASVVIRRLVGQFAINQWNIPYSPRYNIASSQNILVVLQPENGEERIAILADGFYE